MNNQDLTDQEIKDKYAQLQVEMTEIQDQMRKLAIEKGGEIIRHFLQPLFDIGVKQVYWTQFTPYFNDGEPCEFSLYDVYVNFDAEANLTDYPDFESGWDAGWSSTYAFKEFFPPSDTAWRKYTLEQIAKMEQEAERRKEHAISLGYTPELAHQVNVTLTQVNNILGNNLDLLKQVFGDHVGILYRETGQPTVMTDLDHD